MVTKAKTRKAPADEGRASFLTETERGLSVCRPLKSLKTSIITAESLDEFMSLLNYYVEACDREDFVRHYWKKIGLLCPCAVAEKFRAMIGKAQDTEKAARRALIPLLKEIRTAPAKTLDDILFKAEICAVLEPYDVKGCKTVAHSIINDLLSAGCAWMQSSANE